MLDSRLRFNFPKLDSRSSGSISILLKIKQLEAGRSYIGHIPASWIEELRTSGRFQATTNFGSPWPGVWADAILLCVPTPPRPPRAGPPTSSNPQWPALHLRGKGLGLASNPRPIPARLKATSAGSLAGSGKTAGVDFHLVIRPEREDPQPGQSGRAYPKTGRRPHLPPVARRHSPSTGMPSTPLSR